MESKTALIVGASGLVGNELLGHLFSGEEYGKIVVLVRQSLNIEHLKLEEIVIDFDKMADYKDIFKVDDVFCCLGTTIKKAKSKAKFKKVDVDYPLEMAQLSKDQQVDRFLIISSMGANPNSVAFYSRIKGMLEQQLKELKLNSLHIFRPSLLLGARRETRVGEIVGTLLAKGLRFGFIGPLEKYKPIEAKQVALGMYKMAQIEVTGDHTYSSMEIAEMK